MKCIFRTYLFVWVKAGKGEGEGKGIGGIRKNKK